MCVCVYVCLRKAGRRSTHVRMGAERGQSVRETSGRHAHGKQERDGEMESWRGWCDA